MRPFDPVGHKAPGAYPSWFVQVVAQGSGRIPLDDVPWTPESTKNRFRQLVRTLRETPSHYLHRMASTHRWHVRDDGKHLIITSSPKRSS
jgi:hypothetical protein